MGRRVREASLQGLLVLLVLVGIVPCVPLPFEFCGEDRMGVKAIEINSFPVEAGSTVSVTASYVPHVSVRGGGAVITATVLGLPLTEHRDVCSEVSCPVLQGQAYNSSHHGRVPRLILPGTFTVDVRVVVTDSADGRELTCIKTSVPIHSKGIFSLATVTTHPLPFPDPSVDTFTPGMGTGEGQGRKRDGATAIQPLAQQLLKAMEQYLQHRPQNQPLLRGGSHPL